MQHDITRAGFDHALAVLRRLRPEDAAEITAGGFPADPFTLAEWITDPAAGGFTWAWTLDGRPIGLFGVRPGEFDGVAYIWALLTPTADNFPVQLHKAGRQLPEQLAAKMGAKFLRVAKAGWNPLHRHWLRRLGFLPITTNDGITIYQRDMNP